LINKKMTYEHEIPAFGAGAVMGSFILEEI
jgi:hypothetical protein